MDEISDGEDVASPLLARSGPDEVEEPPPALITSELDPKAPVFVPGALEVKGGSEPAAAASGPSLVFSGGGKFLSKYAEQQQARPAPQKRTDATASRASAAPRRVAEPVIGVSVPDRVNVQVNSMLVHARHHDKILQVVDQHFDDFNAVNLITALHRLATVILTARKGALRRDSRFKRLIQRLSDTLKNSDAGVLKPQDLSNVAWALTKLGLLNGALFGHLSDHIMRTISSFEPVNLSMTLWAFARSNFLDEKLFRCAAVEVKRQMPDFQPQQIANTTWAMAKSGFVDEEVFLSAANLALQKLSQFQPMNYSMLLYSFALAKMPHPKLFDEVGQRCTVEALSSALSAPHVVTNLALAFSDAGVANSVVFNNIAQVSSLSLHDFRAQQITTLTQAFAKANVKHERLFSAIAKAVVDRYSEFKEQDLQDLLQSYEILGVPTTDITRAINTRQTGDQGDGGNAWLIVSAILVLLLALTLAWRLRFFT